MTLQTHIAAIEEAAQTLESAASHNTKQGRTIFAHTQQERAKRLRDAAQAFREIIATLNKKLENFH